MPGPGWYFVGAEEEAEVADVLGSRELTRYRFGDPDATSKAMLLEREIAGLLGVRHVLAVNSGTSALLAGLTALGVGPGDEVIVPGYTFIASIASVVFTGATPVLAEVDTSLTLDPADVARRVTPRTKAIMPVHMLGAPADMDALLTIARDAGCAVVEDAAQACGGSYRGRRLGAIGDVGAFSLSVGKTMTAGDGGLLSTSSPDLYRHAFAFHDHGFAPERAGVTDEGPRLGLNLRMHELAAAVALAQARRLDAVLDRCRALKRVVAEAIGEVPGATRRVVHDPDGECATTYVLVYDDPARAARVAERLGGNVLGASTKHNYARMAQLHGELTSDRVRNGSPGALPATDDVLGRSVALSIGVVDGYLGTLGPINVLTKPEEGARLAAEVRAVLESA
jgi:dTDP-4-amino-4,6-dideoxygalactose transaminase